MKLSGLLAFSIVVASACHAPGAVVTINSKMFELNQFTGASVTYRSDGSVNFDGKLWDNEVGVDSVTLGELASGQFGSDPGDQVTLQSRGMAGPDWLQLNYSGGGIQVTPAGNEFVIYEITSASSGVDTEGTSFRVQFNGGAWINASSGLASFFAGPNGVENTNQIVFDLLGFGFSAGDFLSTVRIENLDTGSGTSDPDFIFAGLTASPAAIPEPTSLALLGMTAAGFCGVRIRRRRKNDTADTTPAA